MFVRGVLHVVNCLLFVVCCSLSSLFCVFCCYLFVVVCARCRSVWSLFVTRACLVVFVHGCSLLLFFVIVVVCRCVWFVVCCSLLVVLVFFVGACRVLLIVGVFLLCFVAVCSWLFVSYWSSL